MSTKDVGPQITGEVRYRLVQAHRRLEDARNELLERLRKRVHETQERLCALEVEIAAIISHAPAFEDPNMLEADSYFDAECWIGPAEGAGT